MAISGYFCQFKYNFYTLSVRVKCPMSTSMRMASERDSDVANALTLLAEANLSSVHSD